MYVLVWVGVDIIL